MLAGSLPRSPFSSGASAKTSPRRVFALLTFRPRGKRADGVDKKQNDLPNGVSFLWAARCEKGRIFRKNEENGRFLCKVFRTVNPLCYNSNRIGASPHQRSTVGGAAEHAKEVQNDRPIGRELFPRARGRTGPDRVHARQDGRIPDRPFFQTSKICIAQSNQRS